MHFETSRFGGRWVRKFLFKYFCFRKAVRDKIISFKCVCVCWGDGWGIKGASPLID